MKIQNRKIKMKYYALLVFVCYVGLCCSADAHQESTLEELFSWFPSGSYNFLNHADLERAKAGKGWAAAEAMQAARAGVSTYDTLNWLPPSFRESCTSYTIAEPLKVKIDKSAFEDISAESRPRPFLARRAHLCVYRFDSLPDLVKSALEAGEISDTGVSYRGLKIFSYDGINYSGERTKMFAAAAFGLEWLVAEDINSLRLMIATGLQAHPCILDDDVMADILGIIPDLGETWLVGQSRPYSELQQEYYLRNGETEADLKEWREQDMQQPVYTFTTKYFADGYTEKEIRWYVDEERAAGGKLQTFSQRPSKDDDEREYKKLMIERQTVEVVDNLCIITTVYDKELLEATVKYNLAQAEYWKKQEQEKKK